MNVYRYETDIKDVDFITPTIFLAGCTVRGNQTHLISWRFEAIKLFESKGFDGNLIVPEFTNIEESDKYRYDIPVWEFYGLTNSHVIMFWIPRTKELIGLTTNHELGYWMARDRQKIVYGRPDDAYRINYCDIMWVEDAKVQGTKCPIYNTLDKTINASLDKVKSIDENKLLPCPACGNKYVDLKGGKDNKGVYHFNRVQCQFCGTCGPWFDGHPADAISGWNSMPRK